ncbi:DsbA family protein [Cardiobacterium hominis]|uniref:DsbA family oxidoreductase n=1 Tax=Cardiobacterium hominis TaxID=2718 RepID=UPI00370DD293
MKIDIWSDVICPFCTIGKRKLELALAQTGINADIEWHSFELNPHAPPSYGMPLPGVLHTLYGMDEDYALGVLAHEEAATRAVGLEFRWRDAKPGNTFDVHRLLHLGKSVGLGGVVKDRFLRAYFSEGQEIGNPAVLRVLAQEAGLEAAAIDEVLASDLYADAVRADERRAAELGIRGVPYFLIDGQMAIAGAQDVTEFVRVLQARQNADARGVTCDSSGCALS